MFDSTMQFIAIEVEHQRDKSHEEFLVNVHVMLCW